MSDNDLLKRLIDAGMTLTMATQAKAEELIRELARATESQADSAQTAVEDLLERSRHNRDRIVDSLRSELYEQADAFREQIENLGLATKDDINRLGHQIAAALGVRETTATDVTTSSTATAGGAEPVDAGASRALAASPAGKAAKATRKAPTAKARARKSAAAKAVSGSSTPTKAASPATKAPAKKAPATKAPAKKSTARKAPARKAPAKKSTTAAKTTPAKKATAKKATGTSKAAKATAPPAKKASGTAKAAKAAPAPAKKAAGTTQAAKAAQATKAPGSGAPETTSGG